MNNYYINIIVILWSSSLSGYHLNNSNNNNNNNYYNIYRVSSKIHHHHHQDSFIFRFDQVLGELSPVDDSSNKKRKAEDYLEHKVLLYVQNLCYVSRAWGCKGILCVTVLVCMQGRIQDYF
jgi:hypothetical protein